MKHFVRNPEATWRRLPNMVILALPGEPAPLRLNSTGALVWDLLAQTHSRELIVSHLAASCQEPPADVAAALAPLLVDLVGRRVILEVIA